MKASIFFNFIGASLLAIPLIILIQLWIPKYNGAVVLEAKNSNARLSFDINQDDIHEKIQFINLPKEEHIYCEVWSTKSLMGIWRKEGQLIDRTLTSADVDADGSKEILFFSIENDSIFGNALKLSAHNNLFKATLTHRVFVTLSAGKDYYMHSFRTEVNDLDADGCPELIANLNQHLNIRGIYAVDFKKRRTKIFEPYFIHITDFYIEKSGASKRIVASSYANANVDKPSLQRAAQKCNIDTSKNNILYSDIESHLMILDTGLNSIAGPLAFKGVFGMQRPVTLIPENTILSLQTGIKEEDSIQTVRLLDNHLNVIKQKEIKLNYNKDLMSKFNPEIFTKVTNNQKERLLFVGNNDSIYELNKQTLNISFITYLPHVKAGANIKVMDLDSDGDNEVLFLMDGGVFITNHQLADGIYLPTEGKLDYRKNFEYTLPKEKIQGVRTISDRNHHIIQYSFNTIWYFKPVFYVLSIMTSFFILYILQKIQSRKLEARNQQLEKTVSERTHEILLQKELIEEKQKEILDSINYAKRIQEAILPSRYSLTEHLQNGFVLYRPKDIVAGDFYWLETTADYLFIAAADCTGHGVPGAMVSVICSNALSKALLEDGILETGKILDRTRELVIEKFAKSDESVRDGMDISLIRIEYNGNSIQYSGANNPLWRINDNKLTEYKADKQPIGNYADPKPFTTHTLEVSKGDILYLFTDGYEDQFGGDKGKKFKASKMKEMLTEVSSLPMDQQKTLIHQRFDEWRGELEQVDDVCVIGIRI